jgi:MFS superfamily sulfate permease-like transporter
LREGCEQESYVKERSGRQGDTWVACLLTGRLGLEEGIGNRLQARLLTEICVTCRFVSQLVQVLNTDALAATLVSSSTLLLIVVTLVCLLEKVSPSRFVWLYCLRFCCCILTVLHPWPRSRTVDWVQIPDSTPLIARE